MLHLHQYQYLLFSWLLDSDTSTVDAPAVFHLSILDSGSTLQYDLDLLPRQQFQRVPCAGPALGERLMFYVQDWISWAQKSLVALQGSFPMADNFSTKSPYSCLTNSGVLIQTVPRERVHRWVVEHQTTAIGRCWFLEEDGCAIPFFWLCVLLYCQ